MGVVYVEIVTRALLQFLPIMLNKMSLAFRDMGFCGLGI